MFSDASRNAVIRFCNTTGDGGNRITITTDGNCMPDRIFERGGFKKSLQCLGHATLASDIKGIFSTDIGQGEIHGIVIRIDIVPDLHHITTCSGHIHRHSGGFRAFQTFWMIVSNGCYKVG